MASLHHGGTISWFAPPDQAHLAIATICVSSGSHHHLSRRSCFIFLYVARFDNITSHLLMEEMRCHMVERSTLNHFLSVQVCSACCRYYNECQTADWCLLYTGVDCCLSPVFTGQTLHLVLPHKKRFVKNQLSRCHRLVALPGWSSP